MVLNQAPNSRKMKQTIEEFYLNENGGDEAEKTDRNIDTDHRSMTDKKYTPPLYRHETGSCCYSSARFSGNDMKEELVDVIKKASKTAKPLSIHEKTCNLKESTDGQVDQPLPDISHATLPYVVSRVNEEQTNGEINISSTGDDNDDKNHEARNRNISDNISHVSSEEGTEKLPQLSDKLGNPQVTEQFKTLNNVLEIDATNLDRLQQLNRSDPSIKRLMTRTRLTSKEVKDIIIDEDIKATVNEFLQTNVVGNFIITRIFREHYCTFYSWLASHLQVERNAWAARLKLVLQNMDKHRKELLEMRSAVTESARRMRHQIHTCHTVMSGSSVTGSLDGGCHPLFTPKIPEQLHHCSRHSVEDRSESSFVSTSESTDHTSKQSFHKIIADSERPTGRNEGIRSFQNSPSDETDSTVSSKDVNNSIINQNSCKTHDKPYTDTAKTRNLTQFKSLTATSKSHLKPKDGNDKVDSKHNTTEVSHHRNQNTERLNEDEESDWKQVMFNCTQDLSEMCDRLVQDRADCYRLLRVSPNSCPSLAEALSQYMQGRHTSNLGRREELEKKLRALESENRSVLSEAASLQSTLSETSEDVVTLQNQLDRIEALVGTSSQTFTRAEYIMAQDSKPTWNKCLYSTHNLCDSFLGKAKSNISHWSDRSLQHNDKGTHLTKTRRKHLPPDYRITCDRAANLKYKKVISSKNGLDNNACRYSDEKSNRDPRDRLKKLKSRATKLENSVHEIIAGTDRPYKPDSVETSVSEDEILPAPKLPSPLNKASRHWLKFSNERYWQNLPSRSNNLNAMANPVLDMKHTDDVLNERNTSETDLLAAGENSRVESDPLADQSACGRTHTASVRIPKLNNVQDSGHTAISVPNISKEGQMSKKMMSSIRYNLEEVNNEHSDSMKPSAKRVLRANVVSFEASPSKHTASRFPQQGTPVTKCLRCQKQFNSLDNHDLAGCYHTKGLVPLE